MDINVDYRIVTGNYGFVKQPLYENLKIVKTDPFGISGRFQEKEV